MKGSVIAKMDLVLRGPGLLLLLFSVSCGNSLLVRPLQGEAEFKAAAAVRAAAFSSDSILSDARRFDRKLKDVEYLMQDRQAKGSEFLVALCDTSTFYDSESAGGEQEEEPEEEEGEEPRSFWGDLERWLGVSQDNFQSTDEVLRRRTRLDGGSSILVGMVDVSTSELRLPSHQLPQDDSYICALSVLPEARRRGVGRALMKNAEVLARKQFDSAALWLHVEREASGALALYRDLGFEALPAKREYEAFSDALDLGPRSGGPPSFLMSKDISS